MRLFRVSRTRSTNHRARSGEPIASRSRRLFLHFLLLFFCREGETLRGHESFINHAVVSAYVLIRGDAKLFLLADVNQWDPRDKCNYNLTRYRKNNSLKINEFLALIFYRIVYFSSPFFFVVHVLIIIVYLILVFSYNWVKIVVVITILSFANLSFWCMS